LAQIGLDIEAKGRAGGWRCFCDQSNLDFRYFALLKTDGKHKEPLTKLGKNHRKPMPFRGRWWIRDALELKNSSEERNPDAASDVAKVT
jgi:hypothetical protein